MNPKILEQLAVDYLSSSKGRMAFYNWIVENGLCNPLEATKLEWSNFKRNMDILTAKLQENLS